MSTKPVFPPSVNTSLSSSSDPVAPPSPSKSPIGVGAPGSKAPSTSTTVAPSSSPTAGFGGFGGLGSGIGGLGGLGAVSVASGSAKIGLNSAAAVFSAINGETKGVSAAANAPIFKPSGQSDLFRSVNASLSGSRLKLSVRVDQVCC